MKIPCIEKAYEVAQNKDVKELYALLRDISYLGRASENHDTHSDFLACRFEILYQFNRSEMNFLLFLIIRIGS